MAYTDIYAVIATPESTLRKQVVVALRKARTDIMNEAANTPNHSARVGWADSYGKVTNGSQVDYILGFVLDNPTIAANVEAALDADVQFVVNSIVPSAS